MLLRVTEKSAINIECHVGYYDVLIDCLTTSVSRQSPQTERLGDGKTFDAPLRHFLTFAVAEVFSLINMRRSTNIEINDP